MPVLARSVDMFLQVYVILIFVRVIMSWIRPGAPSPLVRQLLWFVYSVTEPLLGPIRRILPAGSGIDFSPLVALLLINWLLRPAIWRLLMVTMRF